MRDWPNFPVVEDQANNQDFGNNGKIYKRARQSGCNKDTKKAPSAFAEGA